MSVSQITQVMAKLALRRPVFHSEADFQHELAMELSRAGHHVRLEVPCRISLNGVQVEIELDILTKDPASGERTAIELKYVKRPLQVVHQGEAFNLKGSWGTNLSRFDCFADFQRIESLIRGKHTDVGFTLFLSNAETAWADDVGVTGIVAQQFSLHDGRIVAAGSLLDWTPPKPSADSVTRKRLHPWAPITLHTQLTCKWTDFSVWSQTNGRFRYLLWAAGSCSANTPSTTGGHGIVRTASGTS